MKALVTDVSTKAQHSGPGSLFEASLAEDSEKGSVIRVLPWRSQLGTTSQRLLSPEGSEQFTARTQ
jgi:hypothetical protein